MLGLAPIGSVAIADVLRPGLPPPPPLPASALAQGTEIDDTALGPSLGFKYTSLPFNLDIPLGAAAPAFVPGIAGMVLLPTWVQVLGWGLATEEIGTITVDIWRKPLAQLLVGNAPSAADSICGGSLPTLTGPGAAKSTNVSGWSVLLSQNDVLFFDINAVSGSVDTLEVVLFAQRSNLQ